MWVRGNATDVLYNMDGGEEEDKGNRIPLDYGGGRLIPQIYDRIESEVGATLLFCCRKDTPKNTFLIAFVLHWRFSRTVE